MSRVGKTPVPVPQGVKVQISGRVLSVEGPKGKLSRDIHPLIDVEIQDNRIDVNRKNNTKPSRSLHGLYRSLINNMVTGVSQGYQTVLTINGVGYRAEIREESLVLNLGYSNPIEYPIPEGISISVESNNRVIVQGIDKERLGQVCAEIRFFRPPEPYKGKGIKYEKEIVRRKIGKSGIK